jgi:hypothetical protein
VIRFARPIKWNGIEWNGMGQIVLKSNGTSNQILHSTAQHGTAQHNTPHHNTIQLELLQTNQNQIKFN